MILTSNYGAGTASAEASGQGACERVYLDVRVDNLIVI